MMCKMCKKDRELTPLMQVIYVIGGILIVAAAIKVVYSGCRYVIDHWLQ